MGFGCARPLHESCRRPRTAYRNICGKEVTPMSEENGLFAKTDEAKSALSDKVQESDEEKYLIFRSSNILYALSTTYVVEILNNVSITRIPMVPDYIAGVINLRGAIVPIVDFRLLLGRIPEEESCVIILNIKETSVGIVVDSVDQMVDISRSAILPVPSQNEHRLVSGMCTVPGGVSTIMILDGEALGHVHE